MSDETINESNDKVGSVKITNDVVAIIAGVAATEVKGVVGMGGGITGGISEMLGMKTLSKGVKVEVAENNASIEMHIVVEYGCNLADVGREVQENVMASVENMTGLNVTNIDVNIQGISMPKEGKDEKEQDINQNK
ncbi:MAG: Asp23/Gls24 family envelope stress response protein [Tissierellia bacterium]|nr:Asp23/Gls24 family envelope stress response protein [Tissierellia bacterium]MDD4726156.1 Asp23/Gls24 family envelope stress response protein [Tissierellia bacterium]